MGSRDYLLYAREMTSVKPKDEALSSEVGQQAKRCVDRFTESVYAAANEPSLALYRIREHVVRSLPELVERRGEMASIREQVQGATFDADYAARAAEAVAASYSHFSQVHEHLGRALYHAQQIDYMMQKRKRSQAGAAQQDDFSIRE